MNKPVETIPLAHGVVVKVYQDTDAQNPNDWDGDCCFLWADDRDLCLIERKDGKSTGRIKGVSKGSLMLDDERSSEPTEYAIFRVSVGYRGEHLTGGFDDISDDNDAIERNHAFVLVRRADFPPEHDLQAAARACVEEWNTYLSGDVYGYVIEDAEGEQLESCWGCYGLSYCIEEAKAAAEAEMPVARGRNLIRKLADDMQRYMVQCQDNIDRSGINLPRRDYYWAGSVTANLSREKEADIMEALPRNFANQSCYSLKFYDLRSYSGYGEGVNNHYNGNPLLACLVHEEWKRRYWPGD